MGRFRSFLQSRCQLKSITLEVSEIGKKLILDFSEGDEWLNQGSGQIYKKAKLLGIDTHLQQIYPFNLW